MPSAAGGFFGFVGLVWSEGLGGLLMFLEGLGGRLMCFFGFFKRFFSFKGFVVCELLVTYSFNAETGLIFLGFFMFP